jgi:hypothetical protein
LEQRKIEVEFGCSGRRNALLGVMVPEELVEMVESFRGNEFAGFGKWPVNPDRVDDTVQAKMSDHL